MMYLSQLILCICSILITVEVHAQNRKPIEESHLEGFIPSVNQLNHLRERFPNLNGNGITISIKEQKVDSGDIDFKGRFKTSPLAADFITTHASQMATLAAGAGNSSDYSKGAAWHAWISSSSFLNLLPDPDKYFESGEISVQNHSYGTGIESYYGYDAAAYDSQSVRLPNLLHIFSAGNLGDQVNNSGKYAGLPFGNISGSFKMSKNSLSVGAIDGLLKVPERSSRGPAHDGRIKPELVAFGIDGSSGAAAITTGISAVLQQQYLLKYGVLPPSSLIRGILMNTAKDVAEPGPDFLSGYGNVQGYTSLSVIDQGNFFLSAINPNQEKIVEVRVPEGLSEIRVMLSWIDPSSAPDTSKALINDLDLILEDPSGTLIYPWVLSYYPHKDSLSLPAYRGIDTLNNQEQVTISKPTSGVYKIIIRTSSDSSPQNFALNWYMEKDSLYWTFPLKGDKMEKSQEVVLRWSQPLKTMGNLEIRYLNGWQSIGSVPAGVSFFSYTAPVQTGAYQLRINQGDEYLITDSFTVSVQPVMRVGYLCPDSTLLYWNNSEAGNYKFLHLPENYLSGLKVTGDTLFSTASSPAYYSVAELYNGIEGLRSLTINPQLQGTGCYVSNFLADLISNQGRLSLRLSTGIGISKVKLQKLLRNAWITIDSALVSNNLDFTWIDQVVFGGMNHYRVEIDLGNRRVYSQIESIFYFNQKEVILYPNPLPAGNTLKIATADSDRLLVEFFDGIGRKVFSYGPVETIEQISTSRLRSGIYFYRISREGKRIGSGRLVVQ